MSMDPFQQQQQQQRAAVIEHARQQRDANGWLQGGGGGGGNGAGQPAGDVIVIVDGNGNCPGSPGLQAPASPPPSPIISAPQSPVMLGPIGAYPPASPVLGMSYAHVSPYVSAPGYHMGHAFYGAGPMLGADAAAAAAAAAATGAHGFQPVRECRPEHKSSCFWPWVILILVLVALALLAARYFARHPYHHHHDHRQNERDRAATIAGSGAPWARLFDRGSDVPRATETVARSVYLD
ncbi:MAG TPA: hypothetical protein VIO38_11945 [Rariglobus sp.]